MRGSLVNNLKHGLFTKDLPKVPTITYILVCIMVLMFTEF